MVSIQTNKRDYYEVLGIERATSDEEIKSAFRRLAREYHPDVSGAPDAEVRFKEISEAYEVLSDIDKRAIYDRFGLAVPALFNPAVDGVGDTLEDIFGRPVASRRQVSQQHDSRQLVEIGLAEALSGCTREVVVRRRTRCSECNGQGQVDGIKCGVCSGGYRRERELLVVPIPPGIRDGMDIRIPGRSDINETGQQTADLLVRVKVMPHPGFRRCGDDLYTQVALSLATAVMGGALWIPGLDGNAIVLNIPAGCQPGTMLIVAGAGMPYLHCSELRGDLVVSAQVIIPTQPSSTEIAFYGSQLQSL